MDSASALASCLFRSQLSDSQRQCGVGERAWTLERVRQGSNLSASPSGMRQSVSKQNQVPIWPLITFFNFLIYKMGTLPSKVISVKIDLWLAMAWSLVEGCVCDTIWPMRCMETFTGAYGRAISSVFHGILWPLWPWGWMQLLLRPALPPDFSFVNEWIPPQSFFFFFANYFLFGFSVACKDFYWFRPFSVHPVMLHVPALTFILVIHQS